MFQASCRALRIVAQPVAQIRKMRTLAAFLLTWAAFTFCFAVSAVKGGTGYRIGSPSELEGCMIGVDVTKILLIDLGAPRKAGLQVRESAASIIVWHEIRSASACTTAADTWGAFSITYSECSRVKGGC